MNRHELKIWPEFFEATISGSKPFELRRNDRGFAVGDMLVLIEWDPATKDYTGRSVSRVVTYLLEHRAEAGCAATHGLHPEYVVLGTCAPNMRKEQFEEVLGFLDSIEGAGYGGMAAFEIARMYIRAAAGRIPEVVPSDGTIYAAVSQRDMAPEERRSLNDMLAEIFVCNHCGKGFALDRIAENGCPHCGVLDIARPGPRAAS